MTNVIRLLILISILGLTGEFLAEQRELRRLAALPAKPQRRWTLEEIEDMEDWT